MKDEDVKAVAEFFFSEGVWAITSHVDEWTLGQYFEKLWANWLSKKNEKAQTSSDAGPESDAPHPCDVCGVESK